ncbi:ABC transporter permease [Marinobacter nauticus]|uniref:ABC transporter permease n=1 Tax=Marinobacter nauticus TaxID=2743 RepID=UPI001C97E4A5|nr:ABC transporter permease [Marinobacter nauticus]MBY5962737.1 FtsX-like permease family protein [Marinobacter nauticus]MBY6101952.1 FtsX-like permease family protein [Marinobacter nauticus]
MSPRIALFSHYRRHPLQLAALAAMILLATALWTGIHHLTSQARASLEQSESAVAERQQVVREDGQPVSVQDFVTLRRQGLCVMPWLEVPVPGRGRLVGIDPLAAHCFAEPEHTPAPWQGELDGEPFVDISEAAVQASAEASALVLLVSQADAQSPPPAGYRYQAFAVAPDTAELGDSFLLNLDALGVLVLLITSLLLRSVFLLGLAQRRESLALLYRYGVNRSQLSRLLLVENLLLALVCILPGVWLGRALSLVLADGFGQALAGLFDRPLYAGGGEDWWLPTLTMVAAVVAACLAGVRDSSGPLLTRAQPAIYVLLLALGLAVSLWAPTLIWLFLAVALVFLAAGWLAPLAIAGVVRWLACNTGDPLIRWRLQEVAVLVRRLALPLVALQFALALVLAVHALVTTFEDTFDQWLGQRLEADYYIEVPPGADISAAASWLTAQPELVSPESWHQVIRGRASVQAAPGSEPVPVDVFALGPVSHLVQNWRLLAQTETPWQALARGEGLMVNEQLARRQQLAVGDRLIVRLGARRFQAPVLAVYPDYGRPSGEVLVLESLLPEDFEARFRSLSISAGVEEIKVVEAQLARLWHTPQLTVRDNQAIRTLATDIFDQTFLLTRAMTTLTLILAAAALLLMVWVFLSTRAWYFRLLIVWGMPQRQAAAQLTRVSLALVFAVLVCALPLGVWLTWILVQRINPLAFGWSLPMAVYPGFWIELAVLALIIGLSIALLMRLQLRRPASAPESAHGLQGGER